MVLCVLVIELEGEMDALQTWGRDARQLRSRCIATTIVMHFLRSLGTGQHLHGATGFSKCSTVW
jgi:hypothetical protein